jgi:hypothetical protein
MIDCIIIPDDAKNSPPQKRIDFKGVCLHLRVREGLWLVRCAVHTCQEQARLCQAAIDEGGINQN